MKDKEKQLLKRLLKLCDYKPYKPNKAFKFSDDKQNMHYLEKWTSKGWWEYGVSLRTGWFTPEGIEYFKSILKIFELKKKEGR